MFRGAPGFFLHQENWKSLYNLKLLSGMLNPDQLTSQSTSWLLICFTADSGFASCAVLMLSKISPEKSQQYNQLFLQYVSSHIFQSFDFIKGYSYLFSS